MPRIMITCPVTKKPVYTGMTMDKERFEAPHNFLANNVIRCPHCGDVHRWDKADAYVESE